MAVHGDIKEVAFSHPELGNGRFYPKAAESNTLDTGGIRTSDDANGITAAGDLILTKNRVRGMLVVNVENDMVVRKDAVTAAALSESSKPAVWTVALINGTVWRGTGTVVGDINPDVNTGLFTLNVAAPIWEEI